MEMDMHERALEAAIVSTNGWTAADQPLIELARSLARQMDAEGTLASTRLSDAYLRALRVLIGRLDSFPVEEPAEDAFDRLRARAMERHRRMGGAA